MTLYTAASLEDIAARFEQFAADQIACIRWQGTKAGKTECTTKAAVWRDAASILRNTKLEAETHD